MRDRNTSTPHRMLIRSLVVLIMVALLSAACVASGVKAPEPNGAISTSGFPPGTYTKDLTVPSLGRIRIAWTFAVDGRWAEVPEALDGQAINAPVVRGIYTVDSEGLTIATDYPPGWGSHHSWRLDGSLLWTTFVASDIEGDAEWFEILDALPWMPIQ